ncbi:DUF5808 domain-containing protein [Kitasatospora sp. GP82]|uniref:DUF1648 domain-containing protein n=1 Tax=Kitasatospora sp. GP82 TaxID=3035089 RepID=UPI002474D3F3|nr:DUF5808 domain-containing protein [Kitasatospora sp. GP82]MDH6125025.1 putative membrane protein [Kitasatospora sp. GP82]
MTTGVLLSHAVVPLVLLLMAWLMPALTGPTLPFGVRVPASRSDAPVIAEQRRAYRWWVAGAGGALVILGLALSVTGLRSLAGPLSVLAFASVCVTAYVRARRAIRAAKQVEGWYQGLRQAVAVDTSLRTDPEHFPWRWAVPALLVLAVTTVAAVLRYPSMPDRLPTHYNRSGVADHLAAKSVGTAFAPVFAEVGNTAVILLVAWFAFRARADLDPARPTASAFQHRRFVVRITAAVLVLAACANLSVLLAAWPIWHGDHTVVPAVLLAPVLAGLAIVVGVAIRTGQNGSRIPVQDGQPVPGVAHRDDDRYWRLGGLFYANRQDPAVLVSKRFGIGWTVNFANPRTLLLVVLLVGFAVLMSLIGR